MSLKGEIAELVDWLDQLTSEDSKPTPPVPLPRDDWLLVRDNLTSAVASFRSAGEAVASQRNQSAKSVLADLAFDLGNEAESLANRAFVMSRRAEPKKTKSADELARELESKTAENKRLNTKVDNLQAKVKTLEAGAPTAPPKPARPHAAPKPKTPVDYIEKGQGTLTTARDNLFNVTPAEPSVLAFSEGLEVLNDLIEGWLRVSRRSA